ncbi:Multidrug export protein AcrF [subsurface metagenome]
MKSFFKFFAQRHLLATLITLMTIFLGLVTLTQIKRDMWSEIDMGKMIVTTRYPGASPEDVELNVTNKIEKELKGVSGIERITSFSLENISVIDVTIDPDTRDQDETKDGIREAVSRITGLPLEVTESPLVTELKTSIFPVIEVGLAGDLPYRELREIARLFEKKLEALPGVSSVQKYGYLAREIKVEVSPEAIRKYQIPLREIIAAVRARNIRSTAGSFESYTSEKSLVTLAQFRDPLEVGDVIIRSTFEGPLVTIKDLAIVRDDFEEERILSRLNGRPAISFLINKKETADVIRTVNAIRELADRESRNFPQGIEVLYSMDLSRYVSNRFNVVLTNGVICLTLVIIMLSLFLNFRSAFWVAMGIPVTVLGVIFLLPRFGNSLDLPALAAMIIVIGIIVDDGIIISENIQRHREKGDPPLVAAVEGIREVYRPVLTTVLTTFLAFSPLFFMSGVMGDFIFAIPLVISLALFISLFEATVALPAHLIMGLPSGSGGSARLPRRGWFPLLERPFRRFLSRILKFRYLLLGIFALLLATSVWYALNFTKFSLFPSSKGDKFFILLELPSGSSLRATSDKVKEVEELLAGLPPEELESFATRIGSQEVFPAHGSPGENENWAYIAVNLTPFDERARNVEEIAEDLREKTNELQGYDKILYSVQGAGPEVGKPIIIQLVGSNDLFRAGLADSVVAFLETLEGVKDGGEDRTIDFPGKGH